MLTLEHPDFTYVQAPLVEERRKIRGPQRTPERVEGLVQLGVPVWAPLTEATAGGYAELAAYLAGAKNHRYHIVHFALSLGKVDGKRIDRVWLSVRLRRADDRKTAAPIAWSLTPARLEVGKQISNTIGIEHLAQFKREVATTQSRAWLVAVGEQTSAAGWEFERLNKVELYGPYRLTMVIRSESGSGVEGSVEFKARIEDRLLGLLYPFEGSIHEGAPDRFRIPKD